MLKNRLKELRNEYNYTQEYLASIVNVSRQAYANWENGIRNIDIDALIIYSKLYGVTTDYLLGVSELRTNIKANKELEMYINHCVQGYYRYLKKD